MNFKDSKTKNNLAKAFAGECQEGARYQFIAKAAEMEGLDYVSTVIRKLAHNEMAHAWVFYKHLIELGGDMENIEVSGGYPLMCPELKKSLSACAGMELSEAKNIYPSFAKIAKDEGFEDVAASFTEVAKVENCHHMLISELEKKYKNKKLYKVEDKNKWKCSNCGHEEMKKESWKDCPLCSQPQGQVMVPLADS